MFAVHNALRGSFDLVEGLVERAGSDPVRAAVVADFYDNVLEFLHVHHVGEDELVYPLLEARCTELEDLLERIDAQHRTLDAPMQAAWDAVAAYRAVMGATDPAKAEAGTIRKLHGSNVGENAVHGSDSLENAQIEIAYFFPASEVSPRA